MVGSATFTTVTSSTIMSWPTHRTTSAAQRRRFEDVAARASIGVWSMGESGSLSSQQAPLGPYSVGGSVDGVAEPHLSYGSVGYASVGFQGGQAMAVDT